MTHLQPVLIISKDRRVQLVAGDELDPAVFANDEHRLKVRHFLAVWVNDFRPLHKSNVAG